MSRKTTKNFDSKLKNNSTQVEIINRQIEIHNHPDLVSICEYVEDKFYFATLSSGLDKPKHYPNIHFFSIDNELIYKNFYNDFGPLNLSCLYKYCWLVNDKRRNPKYSHRKIVHYTLDDDEKKRANAAYLIAAYAMMYLGKHPHETYQILVKGSSRGFKAFRDASIGNSLYQIRLQDCLNGLYRAMTFGFLNFGDFDLAEYEKYEKLKYGDLNWIVPDKFIAFIGPSTEPGRPYHQPENYIDYFLNNNVAAVVRLNRPCYDSKRFTRFGIAHFEMFLPDGSTPSKNILNQFLKLAETTAGPIAVHCKAGLGRTGCLIAAYLIKHYKMTAKEAIAWIRICRPGSVIGHQQSWLEKIQTDLWLDGQQYRQQNYGDCDYFPHHKRGVYSVKRMLDKKNDDSSSISDNLSIKKNKKYSDKKTMLENLNKKNDSKNFEKETNYGTGLLGIIHKIRSVKNPTLTNKFRTSNDDSKLTTQSCVTSDKLKLRLAESSDLTQGDYLNKIKIRKLQ